MGLYAIAYEAGLGQAECMLRTSDLVVVDWFHNLQHFPLAPGSEKQPLSPHLGADGLPFELWYGAFPYSDMDRSPADSSELANRGPFRSRLPPKNPDSTDSNELPTMNGRYVFDGP